MDIYRLVGILQVLFSPPLIVEHAVLHFLLKLLIEISNSTYLGSLLAVLHPERRYYLNNSSK